MQKISIQNKEIAYTDIGSGSTIVLIHGFAEDHRVWDAILPFLEKTNRVICINLPGSGKSSPIDSLTTIDSLADIICLFLREIHVDHCVMMGHSMGGYIALSFLEKYPSMLSGLGLIHSTSYADDDIKKQTREKAIAFMDKNGGKAFLVTAIPDLYADKLKHKQEIEKHIQMGDGCGISNLQQYYRAMKLRPDQSAILTSCNTPVLFVCGEHDKAVPLQQSLKQASLASETHIHILKESAHMGMIEERDQLSKIIQDFINHISNSIV